MTQFEIFVLRLLVAILKQLESNNDPSFESTELIKEIQLRIQVYNGP